MKRSSKAEKLVLDEITDAARKLKIASRGMPIGEIISMIRKQLGMSQKTLARLSMVPQATISRLEGSRREPNLSTVEKVLRALSCEVVFVPLLMEPIEVIRKKQAHRVAESNVKYLMGTMSLEDQQPDKKFIEEFIKEEEEELLRSPGSKLWEE